MKLPLRFLLPALILAVLVGFFYFGLHRTPGLIQSPLIGKPAPAFSIASLGDAAAHVGSGDFRGRAWLLNVWATWCAGCREEHGVLLAIARENRLPIMGLNWRDDRSLALSWLEQLGNPYASVGFDAEGRTAIDWGVYGAPETFLIGADGVVLHKQIGPMTMDAWRDDFLPLIATGGGG